MTLITTKRRWDTTITKSLLKNAKRGKKRFRVKDLVAEALTALNGPAPFKEDQLLPK